MIPTYTYAIKENIIKEYLGGNLVVVLINNNNLGITDTPNPTELEARRTYNISNIINSEIGATNLNGYKRHIIVNNTISPVSINTVTTEVTLAASFTAIGGNFDPFTHIVLIRGANLSGATNTNGNNRGDINGTIISIEPVLNPAAPGTALVLQTGLSFSYNFKLVSSDEII